MENIAEPVGSNLEVSAASVVPLGRSQRSNDRTKEAQKAPSLIDIGY